MKRRGGGGQESEGAARKDGTPTTAGVLSGPPRRFLPLRLSLSIVRPFNFSCSPSFLFRLGSPSQLPISISCLNLLPQFPGSTSYLTSQFDFPARFSRLHRSLLPSILPRSTPSSSSSSSDLAFLVRPRLGPLRPSLHTSHPFVSTGDLYWLPVSPSINTHSAIPRRFVSLSARKLFDLKQGVRSSVEPSFRWTNATDPIFYIGDYAPIPTDSSESRRMQTPEQTQRMRSV